jgi:DNA-binding CsgD family transcriptional regulator
MDSRDQVDATLRVVQIEQRARNLGQALIEAAHAAPDFATWQAAVWDTLAPIGFDVAFLKTLPPHQASATRGFDETLLARVRERWPVYAKELVPLTLASARAGVAVDVEVLGPARERMAYYQELVRPQHGTASLYAYLAVGGAEVGGLMLGRAGAGFRPAEVETVRALVPTLAVALAAVLQPRRPCAVAPAAVTLREHEVLRLVQLGYTNPEIARALGTSPNTVRNQVSSLLQKVGATTRAELVGLTVGQSERSPFVP